MKLAPALLRECDRGMNVNDLADPVVLARLLEERAPATRGRVDVAFASGARVAAASAGGRHVDRGWPIGCLMKLFTATLVRRAAARGVFDLDGPIAPLLGADRAALGGVTVRQLLEHTHGLDDSLLAPPRYARSFIDCAELLLRLGTLERFARPGAAYSYGHAGAWLAAAILERSYNRSFAALVREQLLAPLGVEAAAPGEPPAPLCAASGAGLALTVTQLVRVGMHALCRGDSLAGAAIKPLPGWHPLERGVCMGWKHFGGGWFGHQSVWPRASSLLRVQPERGLALAVAASDEPAALVALGLFGRRFPDLFEWRAPPPYREQASGVAGVYQQAAHVVVVEQLGSELRAETWQRDEHGARRGAPTRATLAAAGGVLFARPASEHLPYAELVPGEDGARWLWNGRSVLRST